MNFTSRWSLIAGRLPARTANDVKNYWNTHLHKKLKSPMEDDRKESGDQNSRKTEIIRPRPRTFTNNLLRQRGKTTFINHTQRTDDGNSTNPPPISSPWEDGLWWWDDNNLFGKMGTKIEFTYSTAAGGGSAVGAATFLLPEEGAPPPKAAAAGETSSVQGGEKDWDWNDAVIDNEDLWDLLKL
ncbi:hypothetical protein U1Q18_043045 [Sarracenia purpurea var. burkii]